MRLLTVQDIIDIQQAEQHHQEPLAVAKATGKTLEEVLACRQRSTWRAERRCSKPMASGDCGGSLSAALFAARSAWHAVG